jgi:hypothetical protein
MAWASPANQAQANSVTSRLMAARGSSTATPCRPDQRQAMTSLPSTADLTPDDFSCPRGMSPSQVWFDPRKVRRAVLRFAPAELFFAYRRQLWVRCMQILDRINQEHYI